MSATVPLPFSADWFCVRDPCVCACFELEFGFGFRILRKTHVHPVSFHPRLAACCQLQISPFRRRVIDFRFSISFFSCRHFLCLSFAQVIMARRIQRWWRRLCLLRRQKRAMVVLKYAFRACAVLSLTLSLLNWKTKTRL